MPWADVITDQPGACLGSQAWAKHDVTRLHTKSEVRVKCNTLMHQAIAITFRKFYQNFMRFQEVLGVADCSQR